MHIMEGYLPVEHALGWSAAAAPFVGIGTWRLARRMKADPESRLFLGASGGFSFVLSALKLPSVTGSCSHPTGVGLGAILFGPWTMGVLGTIVLLFQALFLAHGGLTTLGANAFSMAVVGSWTAWAVWRLSISVGMRPSVGVFLAAFLSDLATYVFTSLQLSLAFPDPVSGFAGSAAKFLGIFAVTQLPLAVSEGLLTVFVLNLLRSHATEQVARLVPALKEPRP